MKIYICLFLVALATLAFEISLSRLMSIVTWYHLGFFAISVAMLGMTSGAIAVLLNEERFTDKTIIPAARKACFAFALSLPASILVLANIQMPVDFFSGDAGANFTRVLFVTLAIATPFFFSGIVISSLLTLSSKPVHRLYGADLIGAAIGCVGAAALLTLMDTVSAVLCLTFIALLSALLLYDFSARRNIALGITAILAVGFVSYSVNNPLVSLKYIKGENSDVIVAGIPTDKTLWNSYSRIAVSEEIEFIPVLWAGSLPSDQPKVLQRYMNIDGAAGTTMRQFNTLEDIDHLQYDVTNIAYFLRPPGKAAIIGVGGAKDVQAAIWFGHRLIRGIEINPIFINLLQNEFREFAGVADYPGVELVVDEARSYLSHDTEQYDILQMSLIDTWASTGAGAFSLSENGLYTVEAWSTFFGRLSDTGIFTVSRWYNPDNLGETARMLSLAVATLQNAGIENPRQHIALVAHQNIATLILSRAPLSSGDIQKLEAESTRLKHNVIISPQLEAEHSVISSIVAARTMSEIDALSDQNPLNISVPTDQSPYFFNMLKLGNIGAIFQTKKDQLGVIGGNLRATVTLLILIGILVLLTIPAVILPAWVFHKVKGEDMKFYWPSAFYFMLIGAGFMALEIGLLQRLSVYLGHPIYALSVLLFGIILSTGIGSLLSERLPRQNVKALVGLSVITALSIVVLQWAVNFVIEQTITQAVVWRVFYSVAILFPTGLLLGCFFPTGMQIVRDNYEYTASPWYWALNGMFGVLFSALAVFISIYFSIATNFHVAAIAYIGTAFCLYKMHRKLYASA